MFAFLVAVVAVLAPKVGGPERCDGVSGSMVRLELAGTTRNADTQLLDWQEHRRRDTDFRRDLRTSILLDFAFLLAYSTALVLAVKSLGRTLGGPWSKVGAPLAWLQWGAGGLDYIENIALLRTIPPSAQPWPGIAVACAAVKFLLVGAGLAFVLIAGLRYLKMILRSAPSQWPTPVLWLTPLSKWLASYPVLVGTTLVVLAVLYRRALVSFGIPDLFWHQRFWSQLGAGFGVGLLIADLSLVGFLIDAQLSWVRELGARLPWPPGYGRGRHAREIIGYLCATVLPLLLAVLASAWSANTVLPVALMLGAITGVTLLSVIVVIVWANWSRRRSVATFFRRAAVRLRAVLGGSNARQYGLAVLLVLLRVFFLLIAIVTLKPGSAVPAAFAICLLLSNVTALYGLFVTLFTAYRFGVTLLLVLIWIGLTSVLGPQHRIRDMSYENLVAPSHFNEVSLPASGLANDRAVLGAWKRQPGNRGPLIVIAVDGGGVRAATWVMSVVTQLEQDLPGFAYQVRIVTGASGGMVGAAYWVASLQKPGVLPTGHASRSGPLHRVELVRRIAQDTLTPLAQRLAMHDVVPVVSWFGRGDRGDVLDEQWRSNTDDVMGVPFRSLQGGEAAGWRPSLIVSPMIVEDGRRLLISNLDLEEIAVRRTPERELGRDGVELGRMFKDAAALRLSTAVRMNATFPYVLPSVELPTSPRRRTVDAGYYEEHGVDLATTWILQNSDGLTDFPPVILVEIPDGLAEEARKKPCDRPITWADRGLSGLLTPPQGLLAGRDSSAAFRNDQMIEEVARTLRLRGHAFHSLAFEPYESGCDPCGRPENAVALSWRLTGDEERFLRDNILSPGNCAKRRQLRKWWVEAGGTPPPRPLMGCPSPSGSLSAEQQ